VPLTRAQCLVMRVLIDCAVTAGAAVQYTCQGALSRRVRSSGCGTHESYRPGQKRDDHGFYFVCVNMDLHHFATLRRAGLAGHVICVMIRLAIQHAHGYKFCPLTGPALSLQLRYTSPE